MKKHSFYILKSLLLILLLSLIVISEYGVPFERKIGKGYINEGKLWNAGALMPGANPIVLDNHKSKTAVLIIHDYSGTPANARELAYYLNRKKYDVFVPLLPGHGTHLEDFKKTRFGNFSSLVARAYDSLKTRYKKIIGVGLSTGGSILMKLLIEKRIHLEALTLINSPIMLLGYTRGKYTLPDFRMLFSGILRYYYKQFKSAAVLPGREDAVPWQGYGGWIILDHIHFLKIRLRKIKKHCFRISVPVLILHSNINRLFPPANAQYIYNHVQSKIKKLEWIDISADDPSEGQHLTVNSKVKQRVFHSIGQFIQSFR